MTDGKAHRAWRGMLPGDVVPARYGALIYDRAGHSSRVHWQEKPAIKEMPLQSDGVDLFDFSLLGPIPIVLLKVCCKSLIALPRPFLKAVW